MHKTEHNPVIMVVEDHAFQRKTLLHQVRGLGYHQLLEAKGVTFDKAASEKIREANKES